MKVKSMFLDLNAFCHSLKQALNSNDLSVAIASDNDLDGLFSAIKLDMGLYNLYEIEVETFFRDELRWEIPIDQKFDLLIMTDLAYENTPNYRNAASKATHSFAIDHHVTGEAGFPKRVISYNPCKDGQCYQPATFLVDKVIQKLGQETDPLSEYLNLIGVLADAGINFKIQKNKIQYFYDPALKEVYDKGLQQFGFFFEKKIFNGLVYPRFKAIIEALNYEAGEVGWKEIYLRFINEVTDLSAAQELVRKIEEKNKESFFELIKQIPKEPTELTKSGIWIVKNTMSISNGTMGRIIAELIGKPIVAYSCKEFCRVSARAPADSTINFIPIFTGFGGGHPKACGAFLSQSQFQSFFAKIKEI